MIINVDVTENDIKNGIRGDCGSCPVTLALRRRTGKSCSVGWGIIRIFFPTLTYPNRCYETVWPGDVSGFVSRFDDGRPVSPFTFSIDVSKEVME